MPAGRPTKYNEQYCEKIMLALREPLPVSELCRKYEWMPDETTIYDWKHKHPEFSQLFKEARSVSYYQELENASQTLNDKLRFYTDDKGNNRIDSPSATLAMCALNTKKWLLQKMSPQAFGDKQEQDNGASSLIVEALKDKLNQSKK